MLITLLGVQVGSMLRELRSCMPHSQKKKSQAGLVCDFGEGVTYMCRERWKELLISSNSERGVPGSSCY